MAGLSDWDLPLILLQAEQENKAPLNALVAELRPLLKRIARRQIPEELEHNLHDSDLVQDAFAAALPILGQFKGRNAAEFQSWMTTLTCRIVSGCVQKARAAKRDGGKVASLDRDKGVGDNAECSRESGPVAAAIKRETTKSVMKILAGLPCAESQLVYWSTDGQTMDWIALQLGINREAAYKRVARALQLFRDRASAKFGP
jgi:RNA polymerase sigma factor (sigma-70 family)